MCVLHRKGIIGRTQMKNHLRVNFVPDGIYTTHYCTCFFFMCVVCRFSDSTARKDHTRRAHTHEKPYACSVCHKRFVSSSDLKSHTAVHSNERPFVCPICSKSFKRKNDIRKHKIKQHS